MDTIGMDTYPLTGGAGKAASVIMQQIHVRPVRLAEGQHPRGAVLGPPVVRQTTVQTAACARPFAAR